MLGRAAAELGDLDTAQAQFLRTLGIAVQLRDPTGIALSLDELADTEFARGRPVRGLRLAAAATTIKESAGGEAPRELLTLLDPRERARSALSEEELEAAWAEGLALSRDEAVAYARASQERTAG